MVRPWRFHLGAGALCLDFANTVSWRRSVVPIERLGSYHDLSSWARQVGLVTRRDEPRLRQEAAVHQRRSQQTLAMARSLRETIFAIVAAITERRLPEGRELRSLERWVRSAVRHSRLVTRGRGYRWEAHHETDPIQRVLWTIALSASELLASDDVHRVGQCSGRDCRWLWIDRTRNLSRKWCDMAVCGNRAKARRHYARRQGLEDSATGRSASRRTRRPARPAPATGRRSPA